MTTPDRRDLDRSAPASVIEVTANGKREFFVRAGRSEVRANDAQDARRIKAVHNVLMEYAPEAFPIVGGRCRSMVLDLRETGADR